MSRATESEQLLLDQERFGDDRPQTAGTHQPSRGGDQVHPQDEQVAHRNILAITPGITKPDNLTGLRDRLVIRLNRGGHRQANAALYRAVIVRMRYHQPTVDYVARRTADGRTKREIIRCLKRCLAREIYQRVMTDFRARQEIIQAA